MRGLIMAGGQGTRLNPSTTVTNKHLLPVFDKPMIYYPLTTMLLAGIRNITILSTANGTENFKRLFGDGNHLGINLEYIVQEKALGIAHGIQLYVEEKNISEELLVILGDNIFFGSGMGRNILESTAKEKCVIWTQEVDDPSQYGIAELNEERVVGVEEKPKFPKSNNAITGLYYFPSDLASKFAEIEISGRGEYEITSLINAYLVDDRVISHQLGRGVYWLDAGTIENLYEASNFVRAVQQRQGLLIGSPEEAAWQSGLITDANFLKLIEQLPQSDYKKILLKSGPF